MWPVLGSLITGGAGLLGSMFSSNSAQEINAQNIAMQRETNAMSVAEAQRNREFQEQMSSTAYQRASSDMQRAGLNPMMMFGSGGPASSPGGGQPALQAPRATESPGRSFESLGHTAKSMIDAGVSAKTMEVMTEQISNLLAENARIKAGTELTKAQTSTEEQRKSVEQARGVLLNAGVPAAMVDMLENEGVLKHLGGDVVRAAGTGKYVTGGLRKVVDDAMPFISGAKSAIRHLHEWKGASSTGLTPSQTKNLYDRFEAMRGQ